MLTQTGRVGKGRVRKHRQMRRTRVSTAKHSLERAAEVVDAAGVCVDDVTYGVYPGHHVRHPSGPPRTRRHHHQRHKPHFGPAEKRLTRARVLQLCSDLLIVWAEKQQQRGGRKGRVGKTVKYVSKFKR